MPKQLSIFGDRTTQTTVRVAQTLLATEKVAGDVVSHSTSAGIPWEFAFGGIGYLTKAIISHIATITPRTRLYLWSQTPTGEVVNDSAAFNGPAATNLPNLVGWVDFPAMTAQGTGQSQAICTPSTAGNLPLQFGSSSLYGILVTLDTATFAATACNIFLTADIGGS